MGDQSTNFNGNIQEYTYFDYGDHQYHFLSKPLYRQNLNFIYAMDKHINNISYFRNHMGPVAIVIAIGIGVAGAIGAKVTSDMVEDLKRQINRIVDQHKADADRLKEFQQLLKKLDMEKVYDMMKKVSQGVSGSFKTFLVDQQERMNYIKEIRLKEMEEDPLAGIFGQLMNLLNVIGTGLMAIEIAAATNPATIVFSGVMLVLSGILGIFSMVNNIMAIGELKKKKEELIEYFKPGGEFEKAQIKLKQSAIQVVRNLYLLIVNGKNLLKTLSARIVLIQLESSELDYGASLQALQADPFDPGFQQLVLDSYMKLVQIGNNKSLGLGAQISRMFTILDHMMEVQDIPNKLREFTDIISKFTSETDIGIKIDQEYDFIHKINESRLAFTKRFQQRAGKKGEDLVGYDQRLLKDMIKETHFPQGTPEDKKKLHTAELVSFFTTQFFGDQKDKSGNTLYGYKLQDLQKKTQMLEYVDAFSMSNAFLLPQPVNSKEKVDWNLKKDKLMSEFKKSYKGQDKPSAQFVYMRIENAKKNVAGEEIIVLDIIYGVVIKIRGEISQFEMPIEELNRSLTRQDIIEARIKSYLTIQNFIKFVISPLAIKGVDYVIKGELSGTLQILEKAAKYIEFLPQKWRHYKIGNRTIEEHAKDFQGISINLKQIKYDTTGVHVKNDTIKTKVETFSAQDLEFLCSNVLMYVTGSCLPWRLEAIDVTKNGNSFVSKVEWSDDSNNQNFQGKVLNKIIIKGVKELQDLSKKLRDQQRQLFIVTISSFEEVICWYLE